jgi:hypothetical protein
MRWRVAVNSRRYGFVLDEEMEATDAEGAVLALRDLAAGVVRSGRAQAVPDYFRKAAAAMVESTPLLAFCRYVAKEWNEEHPETRMPCEFDTPAEFVAAAESAGLLRRQSE